ncbi:MAG: Methyl-accepting chemotaxis protein I (serine chemoreceptor protein) [uncultured Paraburkholderia sp.]|nr:MAG: Methyl-accepting chemotaxis protein I (serine chemoreceptor protein) [uncultured Paraburkholderia sp.]
MRLNMTIELRLLGTLTLLGALLVITGLFGMAGMRASNSTVKQAYMNDVAAATELGKSNLNLTVVRTTLDRVLLHPEAADTPALIDKALNYLAVSNAAWTAYQALPASDEEAALSKAVADARGALLRKAIEPMVDIPPLAAELTQKTAVLDKFRNEQGASRYQLAQDRYDTLLAFTLLAIAIGLLACLTSGFSLLRAISRPFDLTVRHFERIAKGDMSAELHLDSRDEMGRLVSSVATMQNGIVAMIEQITSGTESIAAATHQISAGNSDLSQRTEVQAASVEETAASMEQLTSAVTQNAEHARQGHDLAQSTNDAAATGAQVVEQVIATMSEIDASARKMNEITTTIECIAFQTNILALNVAVEAARAGEQGRGFAVVAGEVRTFAQRSAAAAKEIKELIDNSTARVADGSRLINRAGEAIREVRGSVSRMTAIMDEIATASAEQSDGIEEVNRAVSQFDEMSQQNAALVEQAAAAAASLKEQTALLKVAAGRFQLHWSFSRPVLPALRPSRTTVVRPHKRDCSRSASCRDVASIYRNVVIRAFSIGSVAMPKRRASQRAPQ